MADNDNKALTGAVRSPWQEPFSRFASVKGDRSLQSASPLAQFAGSWASSYSQGDQVVDDNETLTPALSRQTSSQLGQPGMPEINFRPFDFGTNRQGVKGPSLMGHPISFEIVGPTLKSQKLSHFWEFIDGDVGVPDQLQLVTADSIFSDAGVNTPPPFTQLIDIYGDRLTPTATPDNLYIVISQAGGNPLGYGLGDGCMPGAVLGGAEYKALSAVSEQAKFEIFRVVDIDVDNVTISLDSNKKITGFFTPVGGGTSAIRAVTFIRPVATRLVALPNSGPALGREQAFVVVPPSRALWDDVRPLKRSWDVTGVFDPFNGFDGTLNPGTLGSADDWEEAPLLPTGKPVKTAIGQVQQSGDGSYNLPKSGRMRFTNVTGMVTADIGSVIHLHSVDIRGDAQLTEVGPAAFENRPDPETLLGWYEVIAVADDDYCEVRRMPEWDPDKGIPFFGDGRCWELDSPGVNDKIHLKWHVYPPVHSLWSTGAILTEQLDATRLTNLIDPDQTRRTTKIGAGALGAVGGKPDRSIFDTSSSAGGAVGKNANPGSLLDLGFRMVLYPAKWDTGGTILSPDWDHPITSREVILDSQVKESQWIDVDYSAGVVTLSHAPRPNSAGDRCDVCPDITTATSGHVGVDGNVNGGIVLFAACVPYSREPNQSGAGLRIMGDSQDLDQENALVCGDQSGSEVADVYGHRRFWKLSDFETIVSGPQASLIYLNELLGSEELPPQGFVQLLVGGDPSSGIPMFTLASGEDASVFGYTEVYSGVSGGNLVTVLKGTYGGGVVGASVVVDGAVAVLRRAVVTPSDDEARVGTAFRDDVTYGQAARTTTLAFEEAEVVPDRGMIRIRVKDSRVSEHTTLLDSALSAWVLSGGAASGSGTPSLQFEAVNVHIKGRHYLVPQTTFAAPSAPILNFYYYVDGTTAIADNTCPEIKVSPKLPLPGAYDILLARAASNGTNHTTVVDLRWMLNRIDRREVITVGDISSPATIPLVENQRGPHFSNLGDAVKYVNELSAPYGGLSVGGAQVIIRVVGPTVETDLPITVRAAGLIIEGAGLRKTDSSITWGGEEFLFEIGGMSNLTFRNLSFLYTGSDPGVDLNHGVFRGLNPTGANLVIEDCLLYGDTYTPACFMKCDPTGTSVWSGVVIRHCSGNVVDSVLYMNTDAHAQGLVFEDNLFTATGSPSTYAAVDCNGSTIHSQVKGNYLTSFARGVKLKGYNFQVSNNTIQGTLFEAILLEAPAGASPVGCQVESNSIHSCHTEAASPRFLVKVDIERALIANNQLGFPVSIEEDAQLIWVTAPHATVVNNRASVILSGGAVSQGGITTETYATVTGNNITTAVSGVLTVQDNSRISNNLAGLLSLPVAKCTNLHIANNEFGYEDTLEVTGVITSCLIVGNTFGTSWNTLTDGCTFKGNTFKESLTLWSNISVGYDIGLPVEYGNDPGSPIATMKTANVVSGNTITGGLVVESSYTQVTDNIVLGQITNRIFKLPMSNTDIDVNLGIFVWGDSIRVSHNTCLYGMQIGTPTDFTEQDLMTYQLVTGVEGIDNAIVTDNKVGDSDLTGALQAEMLMGVHCSLYVWATRGVISGNIVRGLALFGGDVLTITGNHFGQVADLTGYVLLFAANEVNMTGNHAFSVGVQNNIYTGWDDPGNLVWRKGEVPPSLTLVGNTLVGLTLSAPLIKVEKRCTISQNRFLNLVTLKVPGVLFSGNHVIGGVTLDETPEDCHIVGNRICGNLTLEGSGQQVYDNVIRDENLAYMDIIMAASCTGYRIMNNHFGEVTGAGDPDATGGCFLGNRLHGGGIGWFGGAPPADPTETLARTHNKDT